MRDNAIRIGKRFIGEFQRDDVAGLAAELAYRFLFAVFPFGIFVAALAAFIANGIGIADPTSEIMGSLGDNLPPDIAAGIRPQLEAVLGEGRPGLLTIGAVAALWAAKGGMDSLMKAMNRAWEVEETRSFLPKTALAIGLTLLAGFGIIGSFVTVVGASLLTTQVSTQLGLDRSVVDLVALLRWPLVFVLLSVAVAILYHWAPNFRAPWRWCLAGGAMFAVAWSLATWLFSLYVANFGSYANTYGALGGVIVLLLWFYLSALILVSAAAIMASALKELQPANVDARRSARTAAAPAAEPTPPPATPAPRALEPARASRIEPWSAPRSSPPGDWARAGIVTVVGAFLGVALAWLATPRRRA